MPTGIVGAFWDTSAPGGPGLRITGVRGTHVFNEADIPGNVTKTVPAYQTYLDANLQNALRARGFDKFIRSRMRSLTPFYFDFVIFETQAQADAYVFTPPREL
jgi:hypothetical protein